MRIPAGTGAAPRRRQLIIAIAAITLSTGTAAAGASPHTGHRPTTATRAPSNVQNPVAAAGRAPTAASKTPTAASASAQPLQRAPFDDLPDGPVPRTVPYAIGTRVYLGGHVTDLTDRFTAAFPGVPSTPAQRQFGTVIGAAGYAWTDIIGSGADVVHVVGRLSAGGDYTPFHTSTGRDSTLAVTTGSLVVMPESGQAYVNTGDFFTAFTGSANIDCGSCAPSAAGTRVVLDQWSGTGSRPEHQGTWLWYPPATIQRIDDRFRAVGRLGAGWLGLRLGAGCWRIAPATALARLGPALCSLTTPLVSADGRRAVVVQSGRLRVLDPVTGEGIGAAAMAAIASWSPTPTTSSPARLRYAVPAVWESADSYLVTARFDAALALVRCSASTGACQRVVRSTVRSGVDRIVLERGVPDAIPTDQTARDHAIPR
jgi:hypothetical protein